MINLDSIRGETPGCRTKMHFNNAGASLMPAPVVEAMTGYIRLESLTGGYEAADLQSAQLELFYSTMARLLNTQAKNLAFTSSATNSFSRALSCIPFQSGDSILIANEDYISNQLALLSLQKRLGINLLRAGSLPEGGVDVNDMKRLMDIHHPKLVSLTHVPTNTGLVQPVAAVGALCRERDILYLVDGCQSAGQMPIDAAAIGCDFFSGTFRKFLRGPRGAGFLFVSDRVLEEQLEPLFIDMRGAEWTEENSYTLRQDAKRFEDWELPYALVTGSQVAAGYALNVGMDEIRNRNQQLCQILRKQLGNLSLEILDKGKELSSIITVRIPGKEPDAVLQGLRSKNINTSITTRGSAVIDFDAKGVSWALRISPHYYNTEQEINFLVEALEGIIKK